MTPQPVRRSPSQDRSRARVEAILVAAAELLRESNADALTMSRVATRAGSSLASLYRYFPDRTALLRTLAEQYLDEVHQQIADRLSDLESADHARGALRDVLRSYHRAVQDDAALRQLWAGTLADPVLAELSVADNLRNGRIIAERLGPFSPLRPGTLVARCVLLANLAGSAVSLAVEVGGDEGDLLMAEFEAFIDFLLEQGPART